MGGEQLRLFETPRSSDKIAALFVEAGGRYFDIPNVDPWDVARDARTYVGPHPVVAHPPCFLWVNLAAVNWKRYQRQLPAWYPGGSDGGCFESALASVRKWGGAYLNTQQDPGHGATSGCRCQTGTIAGAGTGIGRTNGRARCGSQRTATRHESARGCSTLAQRRRSILTGAAWPAPTRWAGLIVSSRRYRSATHPVRRQRSVMCCSRLRLVHLSDECGTSTI
jgi:hypothetical protein